MLATRRSFIGGIVALIAAPAIVKAEALMPISALPLDQRDYSVVVRGFDQFGNRAVDGLTFRGTGQLWTVHRKQFSVVTGITFRGPERRFVTDFGEAVRAGLAGPFTAARQIAMRGPTPHYEGDSWPAHDAKVRSAPAFTLVSRERRFREHCTVEQIDGKEHLVWYPADAA